MNAVPEMRGLDMYNNKKIPQIVLVLPSSSFVEASFFRELFCALLACFEMCSRRTGICHVVTGLRFWIGSVVYTGFCNAT